MTTDRQPSAAAKWAEDHYHQYTVGYMRKAAEEAYLAGAAAERERECVWMGTGDDDIYNPSCGGSPQQMGLKDERRFCPYCGGKIVVAGEEEER